MLNLNVKLDLLRWRQIYSFVRWLLPDPVLLWRELILRPQSPLPIQLFHSSQYTLLNVTRCAGMGCTDVCWFVFFVVVLRNGTDIFS